MAHSSPSCREFILGAAIVWPFVYIHDMSEWAAVNRRYLFIFLLDLSNLWLLAPFWLVQDTDFLMGLTIFTTITISMIANTFEMLPDFRSHYVWRIWDGLRWGIVFAIAIEVVLSAIYVYEVSLWEVALQNFGLIVVVTALLGVVFCFRKILFTGEEGFYVYYIAFHCAWNIYGAYVLEELMTAIMARPKA